MYMYMHSTYYFSFIDITFIVMEARSTYTERLYLVRSRTDRRLIITRDESESYMISHLGDREDKPTRQL